MAVKVKPPYKLLGRFSRKVKISYQTENLLHEGGREESGRDGRENEDGDAIW